MEIYRLRLLMCCVGMFTGLRPCFSYNSSFWELEFSQFGDAPVNVDRVTPDSPAYQAGLRPGDRIVHPGHFDELQSELIQLLPSEKLIFVVRRAETESTLEVIGSTPHLAAVWDAHWWYPVAGGIFFVLGLLLFGTAPLKPAPYWRSTFVAGAAFLTAVGFVYAIAVESPFTRISIWQTWIMGNGSEWSFGQGIIGIITCLALSIVAMIEMRARLSRAGA